MEPFRLPRKTLLSEITHAKRPIGRPMLRFKDNVKRDMVSFRIDPSTWEEDSQDRDQWRETLRNGILEHDQTWFDLLSRRQIRWFHMISRDRPKKVRILITTYTKPRTKYYVEMNKACGYKNDDNSRFICSICLNTSIKHENHKSLECDRRKSRSCPMCQESVLNAESREIINKTNKMEDKLADTNTKDIQTSPKINADHGLNLLTEVLTVFQNQKENHVKENSSRVIIMKDACISTDARLTKKLKLSVSKIFQVSIEGHDAQESGKFHVVDSCQPKVIANSQCSIDLIKHKSSSIPQMKMDELKNSLKEKTKTNKDAIDEVNRMFANVKRDTNFDNINRPLIRNGPRVLPVVKTALDKQAQINYDEDGSELSQKQICICCQTKQTNYYMSSGDSLAKQERCEKSVNVECCNKNHNRIRNEIHVCERCRKPSRSFDY